MRPSSHNSTAFSVREAASYTLDRVVDRAAQLNTMLGHGRAFELYQGLTLALLGVVLLLSVGNDHIKSVVIVNVKTPIAAIIPILAGVLGTTGVILNIMGMKISRILRLAGLSLSAWVLIWILAKSILIGAVAIIGFPYILFGLPFTFRSIINAAADLPKPAAPGRWH